MDWMTLSVELVGVLILCIWVVAPIQEFKAIFAGLKQQDASKDDEQ